MFSKNINPILAAVEQWNLLDLEKLANFFSKNPEVGSRFKKIKSARSRQIFHD